MKDDEHTPYPRLQIAAKVLTVFTFILNAAYALLTAAVAHEVLWTLMFVGFDVALVIYCKFYFPWIEKVAKTSEQGKYGWLLMNDPARFIVKLAIFDLILLSPAILLAAIRVHLFGWGSLIPW